MKILEIINDLDSLNGAETFFLQLTKSLRNIDNISVVAIVLSSIKDVQIRNYFNRNGIVFYTINKKKGIDLKSYKRFRNVVASENPDVIHLHIRCLTTYFFSFGFKRYNFSLYKTIHSEAKRDSGGFFLRIIAKILTLRGILHFISISKEIESQAVKLYGRNFVFNVNNGLQLLHQKPYKKKYTFICVARFDIVKNHKYLIDSFNKFYMENNDCSLALLGKGPLLLELEKYTKQLECAQNIFFLGYQQDIEKYLNESNFFVLASKIEGLPISILEAMSVGLPIISSKVGGIPDVVKEDFNGFLFDPNIPDALYFAMKKAYFSNINSSISRNNIVISKKYDIEKCAQKYIEIFKNKY